MFIPLTINTRKENGELKNVLIAGDTAGIFWTLSHLTSQEINVYLADTGIRRPLRDFPCHRGTTKDKANVYYDFFDGGIGGGIVRRMDAVITTSCDLKKWTRLYRRPTANIWQDPSGTWLEFEGLDYHPKTRDVETMLMDIVQMKSKAYVPAASQVLIDREGKTHVFPAVETWDPKDSTTTRTEWSAWDKPVDMLGNNESIMNGDEWVLADEERRLIELGTPELEVLVVKHADSGLELRELTGDLARVFDGLFKE